MENIYTLQPTHRGRARVIAFILAVILYLLFLAPLILELKPVLSKKYHDYFPPQSSGKLSQTPGLPPRTTPAPVRYMSAPPAQKQQAPSPNMPPLPAQPPQVTTPAAQQAPQEPQKQEPVESKQQKKSLFHAEKELPTTPDRTLQQQQAPQTTQPTERHAQRAHEQNESESDSNAPGLRRRLREKFYKQGKIPEQTSALNTQAQRQYPSQSAGAQLAYGFSHHMQQQQTFEEETALTNTQNTKGHDSALEAQLFMHNFGMTFCNNSYNEPLKMHTSLIQPHRIELMITCNKQRKVTRVRFIKTSYDSNIDEYIKQLLEHMLTPQIPASVVTSEVTFPISIELERVYQSNVIYFVPGNSKRRGY